MKVIISQCDGFLTKDKTLSDFILNTIIEMCARHPESEFIGLSVGGKPLFPSTGLQRNMMLKPTALAGLWKQIWLSKQVIATIRSEQPSCIISADGSGIKTNIPQCVLVAAADNKLFSKPASDIYIITFSNYLKQLLIEKGYQADGISIIRPVASNLFAPLEWDEREAVKNKYAQQTEYFLLYATGMSNTRLLNVLKAFSVFKKWQKSTARLLIYAADVAGSSEWKKLLPSYKFREDVIVHDFVNDEERALIMSSAMCMLYFPGIDYTGIHLAECMQAHIPVITQHNGAIDETIGDAALYCDGDNIEDIADRMKKVYRDEKLRNQLISKMIERITGGTHDDAALLMWEAVQTVAGGR